MEGMWPVSSAPLPQKPRFDRIASDSCGIIQDLERLRRTAHTVAADLDRLAEQAAQMAERYGERALGAPWVKRKAIEGALELRSALGDLDTDVGDAYAAAHTEEWGE